MSISKYKTFLEVANCESMRKAAANLNLTPSAVSYTISSLEQELGLALFIRTKSSARLTASGRALLPEVINILNADAKLKKTAANLNGLTGGCLRLGGLQIAIARFLPALVRKVQLTYPDIKILPVLTPYPQLADDLLADRLDLAFMGRPSLKQLDFIPLMKSCYMFILPDNHPLRGRKQLSFADLANESFIVPSWDSDVRFQRLLEQWDIYNHISYTISDINTLMAFVQSGFGIGILTSTTLPCGYEKPYPLIEDITPEDFGIALVSIENASPAIKEFIHQAKKYFS